MAKRKAEHETNDTGGKSMMTPQQMRYELHQNNQRLRAELAEQIVRGEDSLLASDDARTRRGLDQKLTAMRNELQRLDAELSKNYGETFAEFRERIGCSCIQIVNHEVCVAESDAGIRHQLGRGVFLFSNGAWSNGRDVHSEPPNDPVRRLPIEIEYLRQTLLREENRFQRIRNYITEQAKVHGMGAGPLPEEKAFEDLKRTEENVTRLREKLSTAQRQLDQLSGPSVRQLYEEQLARDQQAAQRAIQRAMEAQI